MAATAAARIVAAVSEAAASSRHLLGRGVVLLPPPLSPRAQMATISRTIMTMVATTKLGPSTESETTIAKVADGSRWSAGHHQWTWRAGVQTMTMPSPGAADDIAAFMSRSKSTSSKEAKAKQTPSSSSSSSSSSSASSKSRQRSGDQKQKQKPESTSAKLAEKPVPRIGYQGESGWPKGEPGKAEFHPSVSTDCGHLLLLLLLHCY